MLYGNLCFRPRVTGRTFELAEAWRFCFCLYWCVLQAYFVYESFILAEFPLG